jgi:hypothetical protein
LAPGKDSVALLPDFLSECGGEAKPGENSFARKLSGEEQIAALLSHTSILKFSLGKRMAADGRHN